jgi:hypothetical protein
VGVGVEVSLAFSRPYNGTPLTSRFSSSFPESASFADNPCFRICPF